jgi:hypothetical protein
MSRARDIGLGSERPGLALPASGGWQFQFPEGCGSRLLSAAKRRGDSSRGQGRSPPPTVARPSIPGGATEAHQNRSRPYRACTRMAAHPGLRFACPGLTDVGLSGQGDNRDNREERGQDARGTRGRDALATGRQRRRSRATPLRRRLRRAGMPAVHEGGTPSLQDDNGEDRGQLRRRRLRRAGMPAVHEGGTPSLQDDNGEDRGQLRFAEGYAEQGCSRYTRARCPR